MHTRRTGSTLPSPAQTPPKRRTRSTAFEVVIPASPLRARRQQAMKVAAQPDDRSESDDEVARTLVTPSRKRVKLSSAPEVSTKTTVLPPTPVATPEVKVKKVAASPTPAARRVMPNVYAHANFLLLASSAPNQSQLLGRETERDGIVAFLARQFDGVYPERVVPEGTDGLARSLYISGEPGAGKSLLVKAVLADFHQRVAERDDIKAEALNCSNIAKNGEGAVWDRLGTGLDVWQGAKKRTTKEDFVQALKKDGSQRLLVLDEIDHISSRGLVTELFVLAADPSLNLVLIGIANALALTVSNFNSLQLPAECQPELLQFATYTPELICKIVEQRLSFLEDKYPLEISEGDQHAAEAVASTSAEGTTSAAPRPLVKQPALILCSKKIDRVNGDARAILNIIQRAINAVEAKALATAKLAGLATSTSEADALSYLTRETAPQVDLRDMLSAINSSGLGATVKPLKNKVAELTLQSRNVLVALLIAISRQTEPSDWTAQSTVQLRSSYVYEVYQDVLKKEGTLSAVSKSDFDSTIDGILESNGFASKLSANSSPKSKQFAARRSASPSPSSSSSLKPSAAPSMRRSLSSSDTASDAMVGLSASLTLREIWDALKDTPSLNRDDSVQVLSAGAMEETLRISCSMLSREEGAQMRLRDMATAAKKDDLAPMEGFSGNGLRERDVNYIGERRTRSHDDEISRKG